MAAGQGGADLIPALRGLVDRLRTADKKLVVLTGAGISTESGVPDFRSPGSPWRVHVPIGYQAFLSDPAMRAEALRRKFAMDDLYAGAEPNRGHRALVTLAACGMLRTVVTQNIDGLHQAAGLEPARLIELHGNGTYAHCLSCGMRYELADVRRHLEATGEAPICDCGGFIKSATIAFGQPLDAQVIEAAMEASRDCAVFLAIGSSLLVRPAARLPLLAREAGATLVICNREPTPLDGDADLVVRGEAGAILQTVAGLAQGSRVTDFDHGTAFEGRY